MKKKELEKFIEIVEEQFNSNKEIIIEGYEQYLKDSFDMQHKTLCIESWGLAMIGTHNENLNHLPFKELYNFIHSYRSYMIERHNNIFKQKPECNIEFYTDNFLIQADGLGVNKLLKSLDY
jgi:hypothetical protein